MPYFPPVLLASGLRAGATDGAQTFEDGVIIDPSMTDYKGVVIGANTQPDIYTLLYINGSTPGITAQLSRPTGGFTSDLFTIKARNTTNDLSATLGRIGFYGDLGTVAPPELLYLYISSLPNPAYNNANFFMLPSGNIGMGSGNSSPTALLHLAAGTTARAQMRFTDGVAPTSPNDGDMWREGDNLKIRFGSTTYTVQIG